MKKCLCVLLLLSSSVFAQEAPMSLSTDSRLSVIAYSPNNITSIKGNTFVATQIVFSNDEAILNIQSGDSAAWTVKVDENLPYTLFIKPEAYDSHTNMTVITNKHTYYFDLQSNKKDQIITNPSYGVRFIYPQDEALQKSLSMIKQGKLRESAINAFQHPKNYHWDYSFHGDTRLVPAHVFDDGEFTYFQLRPHQAIPAVFAVESPDGKESLVNIKREGEYLVVQRIAPQFTLRSGDSIVASIFNNKAVDEIAGEQSSA